MKMRIDQRGRMVSMDFRTFSVLTIIGRCVITHLDLDTDLGVAIHAMMAWAADEQDHDTEDKADDAATRFCTVMADAGKAVSPGMQEMDEDFTVIAFGVGVHLDRNMPTIGGNIVDDIEGDDDDN